MAWEVPAYPLGPLAFPSADHPSSLGGSIVLVVVVVVVVVSTVGPLLTGATVAADLCFRVFVEEGINQDVDVCFSVPFWPWL